MKAISPLIALSVNSYLSMRYIIVHAGTVKLVALVKLQSGMVFSVVHDLLIGRVCM